MCSGISRSNGLYSLDAMKNSCGIQTKPWIPAWEPVLRFDSFLKSWPAIGVPLCCVPAAAYITLLFAQQADLGEPECSPNTEGMGLHGMIGNRSLSNIAEPFLLRRYLILLPLTAFSTVSTAAWQLHPFQCDSSGALPLRIVSRFCLRY